MEKNINVNCPVAATLHLIGGKYKALLLWHLSGRPKPLGMSNTPKNARRGEADLREKGNRPVEVCIRRGGLCI